MEPIYKRISDDEVEVTIFQPQTIRVKLSDLQSQRAAIDGNAEAQKIRLDAEIAKIQKLSIERAEQKSL